MMTYLSHARLNQAGRREPAFQIFFHVLLRWILRQSLFQSTEPAATEVTFVRGVLLDIGGITLFRGVGMMFMLHQLLVFRHFRIILRTFRAAAGWWQRRLTARHNL